MTLVFPLGVVGSGTFGQYTTVTDASVLTTNAVATNIAVVTTQTGTCGFLEIELAGTRTNGVAYFTARTRASYVNSSGSAALSYNSHEHEYSSNYTAALNVSGADIQIKVTGSVSHDVTWTCHIIDFCASLA